MANSRYGKKIRELERAVLKQSRGRHACPKCGKVSVKRVGAGIWACRSCSAVFAGGAYSPETSAGAAARRALRGPEKPADRTESGK